MNGKEGLPFNGSVETEEPELEKEGIDPETQKILEKIGCSPYELNAEKIKEMLQTDKITKDEALELYHFHSEKEEKEARTDTLTGLYNRRGLWENGNALLESFGIPENKRINPPPPEYLIFGVMDLSGLKMINDTYGHEAGDTAIREISRVLKKNARGLGDVVARTGGDEFALIIPTFTEESIESIPARIMRVLSNLTIMVKDKNDQEVEIPVRADIGFSSISKKDSKTTIDEQLTKADKAMYKVKNGRKENKIETF